eukprot:Gb_16053 [translate_table: standard]
MDHHPHLPTPNSNSREVNSGGIPWNGMEEEEEDWSIDQSSGEDEAGKQSHPYSVHHFDNSDPRDPKNVQAFAEDLEDDEEDEEGKGDGEEDDEEYDGLDGEDDDADWDDSNRHVNATQQQLEQQQQQHHDHHRHHLSSQTETSGEPEVGRNYYIHQNEDAMYADRLNGQEGVGAEEDFESPTEENHDQSGDQTEQETIKAEEEQGEESGYNDNVSEPLQEEQGIHQDKEKDAEKLVPSNLKTPGRGAQKRKSLSSMGAFGGESGTKKPKKKNTNVWTKTSSRKGGKKNKSNGTTAVEDTAFITPVPRLPDKMDDSPDMRICLSKTYKAEKVELSDDRLTAGSTKGYRMVRATRGVVEGAWYFEIKVVHLGQTGHTRLGWSTEKGDVQAPVGYDGNSYSYRDVDGSKVHKAVREPYGDRPYVQGDIIGFYISLPDGAQYAPRLPQYVWYRGQLHYRDSVEEPPKIVPGSEISFFRNGICQGVAFKNINAGRYYPAASMYTLPNESNCTVQFNFGPKFDCYPEDFGDRPVPMAMYEAPYCGIDGRTVEQGESLVENGQSFEKKT